MVVDQSFGAWLKQRRRELDLTQEVLAEQSGCSPQMIRRVEAGTARPSRQLAELLAISLQVPPAERAEYVQWARTGQRTAPLAPEAIQAAEETTAAVVVANPYKGLRAFQESDAGDFFGREALTSQLVSRLGEPTRLGRFLTVVGPSGSGKSSVVHAGLVPALRKGALEQFLKWPVLDIVPGAHPFEEVEAALLRVAVNPPSSLMPQLQEDKRGLVRAVKRALPGRQDGLVLVLDQFEEVFTLVEDEGVRRHFLNSLYAAASDPSSPLVVVATLRADFYDRPLSYLQSGDLLRERTEVVLPMSAEELEKAIVLPAARVGVGLESALLAAIVQDTGEQPGALPLLQYALTELFERREGRVMTLLAYRASGGVHGALSRRAESLYAELNEEEREEARQMFLRLVTLGEGVEDTRRRVRRSEIASAARDEQALERVLDLFGKHRLLTFDRDPVAQAPTVEVAHEALLQSWPRLRDWLDASREGLRIQRRLMGEIAEWTKAREAPSYLAMGARLAQYEALAEEADLVLSKEEVEYLQASVAERERQEAAEQERQARELLLQKRAASRLRYLVAGMAVFLLVAVLLLVYALNQSTIAQTNATEAKIQRQLAENSAATAVANSNRFQAQRLAADSASLVHSNGDPNLAGLLAVRSLGVEYSPEGDVALSEASQIEVPKLIITGGTANVFPLPSTDYMLVASFDSNKTTLWDLAPGKALYEVPGGIFFVFPPLNSEQFLTYDRGLSGKSENAWLWDSATGKQIQHFDAPVGGMSSDGKTIWLLPGWGTGPMTIELRDLPSGQLRAKLPITYTSAAGLAETPDSKLLISWVTNRKDPDKTARVWDIQTGKEVRRLTRSGGYFFNRGAQTFVSPDSHWLVTAGDGTPLGLWDLQTGEQVPDFTGGAKVLYALFSPDGKSLATTIDRDLVIWDLATRKEVRRLPLEDGSTASLLRFTFSPDGKTLLVANKDDTLSVLDANTGLELRKLTGLEGDPIRVMYSADGRFAIAALTDGIVMAWDLREPRLPRFAGGDLIFYLAYSPNGANLLSAAGNGDAQLWDVGTGELRRTWTFDGGVHGVSFSRDGKYALAGGEDRKAHMLDVETGKEIRTFEGHISQVESPVFSLDGKWVLTASNDGTARLWDAATGKQVKVFTGDSAKDLLNCATFSPDGKMVATASFYGTARIWDVATGRTLQILKGHTDSVNSVDFSPDSKWVLTGSGDKTARLWDVQTGAEIRRFSGHTDGIYHAAFSPDGKWVLTASNDGTARLWDAQTGEELRRISSGAAVDSVAFAPDGKTFATGNNNGQVEIWYTDYHDAIRDVCSRLTRDFTDAERQQYDLHDNKATCNGN